MEKIIMFRFQSSKEKSAFKGTKDDKVAFCEVAKRFRRLNLGENGTFCDFFHLKECIRTDSPEMPDIFIIDGKIYLHEDSVPFMKFAKSKDLEPKVIIWVIGLVDDIKKVLESQEIFKNSKYKILKNRRTEFSKMEASEFMSRFREFKLDKKTKTKIVDVLVIEGKVFICLQSIYKFSFSF